MHRFRRTSVLTVATIACLFAPVRAHADAPTAADKAIAETLFRKGQDLLAAGNVEEACARLAESNRLDPRLGTLLNLASCHEQQGKTASAWAEFNEASDLAVKAKRPDRVSFAHDHATALEKKLSKLTLRAPASADVSVKLDGALVGAGSFGTPVPVDPGEHVIEASAPGKTAWSRTITVATGDSQTVEIGTPTAPTATNVLPPPVPSAGAPATGPIVSPPTTPMPAPTEDGPNGRRIAGIALGGVGVVGVVVGAIFGARTLSKESAANTVCPNVACPTQAGFDLHDQAHTSATISTIAFAAGLVGIAAGTVLVVTSGSSSKAKAMGQVWVGPGSVGLSRAW